MKYELSDWEFLNFAGLFRLGPSVSSTTLHLSPPVNAMQILVNVLFISVPISASTMKL